MGDNPVYLAQCEYLYQLNERRYIPADTQACGSPALDLSDAPAQQARQRRISPHPTDRHPDGIRPRGA